MHLLTPMSTVLLGSTCIVDLACLVKVNTMSSALVYETVLNMFLIGSLVAFHFIN